MLKVTVAAAKVLQSTVRESDAPDDSGIRLVPQPDKPGTLMMEILEEPEAGDDVVEESGLRIFVPDELAHELSDRTLDIGVTEQGCADAPVDTRGSCSRWQTISTTRLTNNGPRGNP